MASSILSGAFNHIDCPVRAIRFGARVLMLIGRIRDDSTDSQFEWHLSDELSTGGLPVTAVVHRPIPDIIIQWLIGVEYDESNLATQNGSSDWRKWTSNI
jgi:hypothetical protein